MSKPKKKNPEKGRKNLVVGMGIKNWINDHVKKSNVAYRNGYIPNFVRRRMEFVDADGKVIVDDTYVKIEYSKLRSYGNPKICPKEHITDLINYMKGKNSLFMPGVIPQGEEGKIIKEGNEYRLANMAFRCLSYYIDNIITELVNNNPSEEYEDILDKYITKEDLVAWITTCFKVGHETSLAKTHAWILLAMGSKNILHNEIIERMVTYILVDSKPNEFGEESFLINNINSSYPERVVEVAAGFRKEEAGLIDLTRIKTELLTKYAYQIICNGHQIFGTTHTLRFIHLENAYEFIDAFMKENIPKELEEKHALDIALLEQDGLQVLFESESDRVCKVEDTVYYDFIEQLTSRICTLSNGEMLNRFDVGQYLYFLPMEGYRLVSLHKYILDDVRLFKVFAYCMYRDIVTKRYGYGRLVTFMSITGEFNEGVELIVSALDKFIPDQYGTISNTEHDFLIPFALMLSGEADTKTEKISKNLADAMLRYNKLIRFVVEHSKPGVIRFTTEQLKRALTKGASYNSIMQVADLETNFDFIKETYNSAWIEMPAAPIANLPKGSSLSKEQFSFLRDVLTMEKWRTYPFTPKMMQDYREWFEQFIDRVNIDRYVAAYGIDWVEDHSSISLTDIVESGSYVNAELIARYLDIILLDDNLRNKFLHNKEAVGELLTTNAIREVVDSDSFPNTTKCELIYAALRSLTPKDIEKTHHNEGGDEKGRNIASRYAEFRIHANALAMKCLIGSGFIGRALAYELRLFTSDEIRNSDIFDAVPKDN